MSLTITKANAQQHWAPVVTKETETDSDALLRVLGHDSPKQRHKRRAERVIDAVKRSRRPTKKAKETPNVPD